MQLVRDPERFDVLLLENLYGDIVSDLCAGLVGGLGVVPGANIGERTAVFEAVHGTAPDIAGKGLANPTALMMSAVMMLNWLGLVDASRRLDRALLRVYSEGRVRTGDLGGHRDDEGLHRRGDRRTVAPALRLQQRTAGQLPPGLRCQHHPDAFFPSARESLDPSPLPPS